MQQRNWTSLVVAAVVLAPTPCFADWDLEIGGDENEVAQSVHPTREGGYVVAGWVGYSGTPVGYDFGLLELEADGTIAWQKVYGGELDDRPYSVRQTSDGGFVVAGHVDACWTPGCSGTHDIWILKLDADGDAVWQKRYGGSGVEWAYAIRQTDDGGYVVAGTTSTWGEPCGASCNYSNIWVLKLQPDGETDWQVVLRRTWNEGANTIEQTADGGYVLAAYTGEHSGALRVIKLRGDGTIDWQQAYPGLGGYKVTSAITTTSDLGYAVTATIPGGDVWVARLGADGSTTWQKRYDAGPNDRSHSIRQTSDGGFLVAANTCVPASCNPLDPDVWLLKLDAAGAILWEKLHQGSFNIFSSSVIEQTWDGGYVVAASTLSPGVTTDTDMLLLKVDANGEIDDVSCDTLVDHASTVSDTSIEPVPTSIVPTALAVAPSEPAITPVDSSYPSSFDCYAAPIDLLGTIDDVSHDEGHVGVTKFSFTVDLSPTPHTPIMVDFSTADGTAEAPTDYSAASGSLVFGPLMSSLPIVVDVLGDTTRESDEAFFVDLSGPNPIVYTDDQGMGVILNDDFEADLTLAKSASWEPAPPGGPLTYTLVGTNNGPDTATQVTLTDPLPPELIFESVTPGAPTCTHSAGTVTCSWAAMPLLSGQMVTIEGVVQPDATGPLTNTATISATETDTSTTDNTATEVTQVGSIPWTVTLDGETIDASQTYEACHAITVTDSRIVSPGNLTLRAPALVALDNGFMVESGCELVISNAELGGCP